MKLPNESCDLKEVIESAKKLNWCLRYLCTTCGAWEFRSQIKKLFDRKKLVEELRKLDADFVNEMSNKSVMLVILQDLNEFSFSSLCEELAGTPAGNFLIAAIRIEKDRKKDHRQRMLFQQQNKKNAQIAKAQANIWGAIKRRDLPAIHHLLAKGIDLEQKNADGLSLESSLQLIGINSPNEGSK